MNITVFGLGYVGLSNSILLAQKHNVTAVDVVEEKVALVNKHESPIVDSDISHYLKDVPLQLQATTDWQEASKNADLVIVATPTNYDPETKYFDTSLVKVVIDNVRSVNENVQIVIKSTIPVGYIESLKEAGYRNVTFVPEFLREGKALYDNLYPSRIIVGENNEKGRAIANLFAECALKKDVPILLTSPTEAEAIKLFANTYLALRVAYINELDTYACMKGLNARSIIEGIGLDPRIGTHYCNPSFGYGGYCLPKDTKQLLANYESVPSVLIKAIVDANDVRKNFIADLVLQRKPKVVGIYRLIMKAGSDNFRSAAIFDIIRRLQDAGVEIVVYEPTVYEDKFNGLKIVKNFNEFVEKSELILANRLTEEISNCASKVLTRDAFGYE